jgi:hypothetical protein
MGSEEGKFEPWWQYGHLLDLLRSALTEDEFNQLVAMTVGKYNFVRQKLEGTFLQTANEISDGRRAAADAFEQAREIPGAPASVIQRPREEVKPKPTMIHGKVGEDTTRWSAATKRTPANPAPEFSVEAMMTVRETLARPFTSIARQETRIRPEACACRVVRCEFSGLALCCCLSARCGAGSRAEASQSAGPQAAGKRR